MIIDLGLKITIVSRVMTFSITLIPLKEEEPYFTVLPCIVLCSKYFKNYFYKKVKI